MQEMQETGVPSLGWEDPLEEEMATQSSILSWEIPWTEERCGLQSTGLSKQEYWTGLPFPPPGDLPDPGIERESLRSPALAGGFFTTSTTWEVH